MGAKRCVGVTGAVDAALDDYVTNDHILGLIHAAIPTIRGRLTSVAVVEVADPAFLRRAAVGTAQPVDPPAALGAWVREVLAALDQLLACGLPEVSRGYWWVDDNGLRSIRGRDS